MDLGELCQLMDDLSRTTWDTLTEASALGVPHNDVTTTETNLLQLARFAHRPAPGCSLRVRPINQNEETLIGADFEFWLTLPDGGYRGFSIQAKRATQSSRYNGQFCAGAGFPDPPAVQMYGCAVVHTAVVKGLGDDRGPRPLGGVGVRRPLGRSGGRAATRLRGCGPRR
ncbi:hypothetical protein GCM10023221_32300 [Luteimicrobium xylanilyticum]|uniref:Uncharacterized protein n=1 Tax=Luteimicrobium xylanilyticum TaxID=1133546 RepID=A0A5P9Q806_9MICO|nr:hypothetical protein KDY119_00039 [Luteimicrobium xylanilyticum]